jgi:hypothetical protein
MKFQVKEHDKESFYKVEDWVFTNGFNDLIENGFNNKCDIKLVDWNQWDYEKHKIKPMYVEISDSNLALMFKLTMGQYLE